MIIAGEGGEQITTTVMLENQEGCTAQAPQALVHVQAGGNVVVGQNGVLTIGAAA